MKEQGKLTIEVTTGHCLGGEGNDVCPGKVLVAPRDLPLAEAWKKVRMGYARLIPDKPETGPVSTEASGPPAVTNQDPVPENRDPVTETPKKRKGRQKPAGGKR